MKSRLSIIPKKVTKAVTKSSAVGGGGGKDKQQSGGGASGGPRLRSAASQRFLEIGAPASAGRGNKSKKKKSSHPPSAFDARSKTGGGLGDRGQGGAVGHQRQLDGGGNWGIGHAAAEDHSNVRLDPADEDGVGRWACRACPTFRVDPRSIGGDRVAASAAAANGRTVADSSTTAGGPKGRKSRGKDAGRRRGSAGGGAASSGDGVDPDDDDPTSKLSNECLLSMRVSRFEQRSRGRPVPSSRNKSRNKPRYLCVLRSTNWPLSPSGGLGGESASAVDGADGDPEEEAIVGGADDEEEDEYGYGSAGGAPDAADGKSPSGPTDRKGPTSSSGVGGEDADEDPMRNHADQKMAREEISSFPVLVLVSLHTDGSAPEVRKFYELDQLVSCECAVTSGGGGGRSSSAPSGIGTVQLVFRSGDAVEIDCELPADTAESSSVVGGGGANATGMDAATRRDKFLYCLLQVHTILCTAVVERAQKKAQRQQQQSTGTTGTGRQQGGGVVVTPLPPLVTRNVDRTELQYLCTVNGFLADSPALFTLMERDQRFRSAADDPTALSLQLGYDGLTMSPGDERDMSRRIFQSEEEEKYAEEILNSEWTQRLHDAAGVDGRESGNDALDAAMTAENLTDMLQKKMRNLEADACRRLIAWEDEKHSAGESILRNQRDCIDALSLVTLFSTLDELDVELAQMEGWLRDRAAFIKPLTDDCREIEEENRGLEQQWKSYDMLGTELGRLLSGLEVSPELEGVLRNPRRALCIVRSTGAIDVENSEKGVDMIKQAGRELKSALDRAAEGGGVHLRAVYERVEDLIQIANTFCSEVTEIVTEVMRQLAAEMVSSMDTSKMSKSGETHATMARRIRDAQRRFQSSLLMYIKLIEILALLKPETLPSIRQVYASLVAEGILSKKTMKAYFQLLPGRTSAGSESSSYDLRDYPPASLKHTALSSDMTPVNAEDIGIALQEMLPVIAREAYFTAALFGLSGKHLDGRQKKRNFEAAKKSVDDSSVYFRYYLSRACGIAETEGGKPSSDNMLSLVASIYLNESMEGYIDRQKKGGDHSLSLAYVRATILDFRKKVDKKWVDWIEDNIKWIKSNPGVPVTGKRAGVFMSFARFPSYLDHVLLSCRAGRSSEVNLSKIKVISYYLQKMAGALFASLHECASRETTDQQYAANVMRMENSYFFLERIKKRGPELVELFQKQLTAANAIYKQSTDAYLGWMIKREFKGLHSLFSNVSRIRREVGDADVPIHVPRAHFVKTLTKESSREVMKEKIAAMYLRMEKHLSESSALLPHAWKSLVRVLYEWFGRWEKLSSHCYNFKLEPGAVEVVRIAKSVGGGGGGGSKRPQPKDSKPDETGSSSGGAAGANKPYKGQAKRQSTLSGQQTKN